MDPDNRLKSRHVIRYLGLAACVFLARELMPESRAEEVRYYRDEYGVTWREVRRPAETAIAQSNAPTDVQYREKFQTSTQQHTYLAYVPTTQYQWVPRWHGWWRIFEGPHLAYHLEPRTVWRSIPYTVSVPTAQRPWVAETRAVQPAPSASGTDSREVVIRTPVSSSTSGLALRTWGPPATAFDPYDRPPGELFAQAQPLWSPAQPLWSPPTVAPPVYLPATGLPGPATTPLYGGIARMDGDPPRASSSLDGEWRSRQ